jgi:phage terminase small subunit
MTQVAHEGQGERPAKRHRSRKFPAEPLAAVPDAASLGPAMRELTAMQRRFCYELHSGVPGYGSLIRAAKAAGYSGSDLVISVIANQLLHHDKVQAGLKELGHKRINAAAFQVIKNVEAIAADLQHPHCLKAAEMLLNRGGFGVETTHHVTVEHRVDYTKQALEELATFRRLGVAREQLEQIYGRDGLFHLEQQLDPGKLIDGKVESEAD